MNVAYRPLPPAMGGWPTQSLCSSSFLKPSLCSSSFLKPKMGCPTRAQLVWETVPPDRDHLAHSKHVLWIVNQFEMNVWARTRHFWHERVWHERVWHEH